jgi:hypothetical protein
MIDQSGCFLLCKLLSIAAIQVPGAFSLSSKYSNLKFNNLLFFVTDTFFLLVGLIISGSIEANPPKRRVRGRLQFADNIA